MNSRHINNTQCQLHNLLNQTRPTLMGNYNFSLPLNSTTVQKISDQQSMTFIWMKILILPQHLATMISNNKRTKLLQPDKHYQQSLFHKQWYWWYRLHLERQSQENHPDKYSIPWRRITFLRIMVGLWSRKICRGRAAVLSVQSTHSSNAQDYWL